LSLGRHGETQAPRLGRSLAERIAAGGYPASLARPEPRRRAAWYRDYIEALIQRDVRQLSRIAGVEVKASATVREADFRGLRKLADIAVERFVCGVVLYDGETSARFGDRLFAVPIRRLWDPWM
jgi:hypothetical protein